jgi:hypothetical protein
MAIDQQVNGVLEPSLEDRLASAQAEGLAANLKRVLAFASTGGPVEFQALDVTSGSGRWSNNQAAHARTPADAIALATEADAWDSSGIYILPSRLAAGVETRHRAPGSWYVMAKGASTTDRDIDRRCVVSADCDVVRPAMISATDAQVGQSVETALRVWDWLLPVVGADALAYVHSGNGRQVWLALDALPANDDLRLLLASILAGLQGTFGTVSVKIDQALSDHKRLLPACGTLKKKGAPGIAERPHRRTAIVTPAQPRRLDMDGLWDLHARLRDGLDEAGRARMDASKGIKGAKAKPSATPRPERGDRFADANGLDSQQVAAWLDLFDAGVLRCPGCGESAGVDVIDHGLKCLHDRCSGKGKSGFRTNVDLTMEVRAVDARAAYGLLAERFGLEPLRERPPRENGAHGSSEPPPGFWDDGPHAEPYSAYKAQERRERDAVRCLTADEFFAAENAERLTIPALGIGPGPVNGFIGQAWAGKTISSCALGIAVALGKSVWGTWSVQQGPWLHLDYEQGRRQTKKLIHRLARGLGVTDEQLRALIADETIRIAVLPDLRLTTEGAADHFKRTFEGVRMVTCDSLRPMLGGLDENSSQVRGYVSALSTASEASGAAVGLIHHGGKTPAEKTDRTRKDMSRGSSGIVDEFQSMFVMSKKKGDLVTLVTHEKDRALGMTVPDFGLRFDDVAETDDGRGDQKWGLRVSHVDRAEMGAAKQTGDKTLAKAVAAVLACIAAHPGIAGTEAVRVVLGMDALIVRAAVNALLADGKVVERKTASKGKGRRFFVGHDAPPEEP